jgi:hypothetical protein
MSVCRKHILFDRRSRLASRAISWSFTWTRLTIRPHHLRFVLHVVGTGPEFQREGLNHEDMFLLGM